MSVHRRVMNKRREEKEFVCVEVSRVFGGESCVRQTKLEFTDTRAHKNTDSMSFSRPSLCRRVGP